MTEDIEVLNEQFPPLSDAELDALVKSIPKPNADAIKRYDAKMAMLAEINKECGVFQDVIVESSPEEHAVANSGKYMDFSYGFGSVGHRSDRADH